MYCKEIIITTIDFSISEEEDFIIITYVKNC